MESFFIFIGDQKMKNYIVYDESGTIVRTGICPKNMVKIQAQKGELIMEGKANDIEDRVINGKIIRKTEREIALIKKKMEPDLKEQLISQRMHEIMRRQAIEELTREGKI